MWFDVFVYTTKTHTQHTICISQMRDDDRIDAKKKNAITAYRKIKKRRKEPDKRKQERKNIIHKTNKPHVTQRLNIPQCVNSLLLFVIDGIRPLIINCD